MSDTKLPPDLTDTIPVSPSTGLDSEVRQFMSRLMTGYESSHRQLRDFCDSLVQQLNQSQQNTNRSLELQIKLAQEYEELVSQRHRRDLEADAARHRKESFNELTKDVRSLALLAGKKYLLGAPLTGNDSHGMQDLLKTLSPEQIEALMTEGTLKLALGQRQLLSEVLMSLSKEEKAAEPKAEAAE